MNYHEETIDLFELPTDYWVVHTVSSDFALGKGFAPKVRAHFREETGEDMQVYLNAAMGNMNPNIFGVQGIPDIRYVVPISRYIQVVTKRYYFDKPSYATMDRGLSGLHDWLKSQGKHVNKIAMPLIGCGLDKLSWKRVSSMVQERLSDIPIEVCVCHLPQPQHIIQKPFKWLVKSNE